MSIYVFTYICIYNIFLAWMVPIPSLGQREKTELLVTRFFLSIIFFEEIMMSYLENNKDISNLIEQLNCMGVRLGKIFFVPGLDMHAPLEDLLEAFGDLGDADLEYLDQQTNGFKKHVDELFSQPLRERRKHFGEFIGDLQDKCEYPLLVELSLCQNIYSVSIDEKDLPSGYGGAWNATSTTYVFAESIEDAIKQGIKLGQDNLLKKYRKLEEKKNKI